MSNAGSRPQSGNHFERLHQGHKEARKPKQFRSTTIELSDDPNYTAQDMEWFQNLNARLDLFDESENVPSRRRKLR
jgi:hypothetical protein